MWQALICDIKSKLEIDLPPPPPLPPAVVVASICGVVDVGAMVVVVFSAGGRPVGATERVHFLHCFAIL